MPAHATKATDRLIALAEQLLARRFAKGEVKRIVRSHHEKVSGGETISPRTLETVISQAKSNLAAATGKTRDEHRNEAYCLYDSIIRDPAASVRDKVRAQEAIDKLLGLQTPMRLLLDGTIDHTGAVGVDLKQLTDEQLKSLEAIAAAAAVPGPAGPGEGPGRAGPPKAP